MYHSVCYEIENPYIQIRPAELARQLDWLLELGYRWATIDEALQDPDSNLVAVTFDDGLEDFLLAMESLRERRIRPTLFICPALLGGSSDWTTSPSLRRRPILGFHQVRALAEEGVDLGFHGWTHTPFPRLAPEELDRQLARGRRWFAEQLGLADRLIAYPYGHCDAERAVIVGRHHPRALAVEPLPGVSPELSIPRLCGTDGQDGEVFRRELLRWDLAQRGI